MAYIAKLPIVAYRNLGDAFETFYDHMRYKVSFLFDLFLDRHTHMTLQYLSSFALYSMDASSSIRAYLQHGTNGSSCDLKRASHFSCI